ncbi:FK506-binding protein 59 [Condylostylus longicornis]|uniref:FK506-binding protein 59 n=1 Tax=Condylostylus longicornis TaxID=2530218 RepID=UPI00244E446B|nr:FK506-binding protein 59 [Condylostylus longicornis]
MAESEIDLSGDGGVLKKILKEGEGNDTPSNGCNVSLHYTGKLVDGKVFDSSVERNEPFEFQLGKGSVIKAFDMGVATMKLKEKCVLTCAPEYAYGKGGSPPSIPPNATLIFELEMMGWKGEDLSPDSDGSIERVIITKSERRKTPTNGAHVKVNLVGKFDGKIFDEREVEFDVGEASEENIIEGIDIAILSMSQGETSKLRIKPKYAFKDLPSNSFSIPTDATVEYTVTLLECERAVEEWKLNAEESLVQAKIFKEKGTKYVKKENYKLAIKMYTTSNNFLSNCDVATNNEAKLIKCMVHLNIALCQQKLNDFIEAQNACNVALELDDKNVKGYYRRGQCYISLNEYDKALQDFEKVQKLDPSNKATVAQIAYCKRKKNEFYQKEKKIYANMFAKFAASDSQKQNSEKEAEPDILSSCGEWTGQEADKAFEQDENIIMLNNDN